MNLKNNFFKISILIIATLSFFASATAQHNHEEHNDGHDHSSHSPAPAKPVEDHSGHNHQEDGHDGHDAHNEVILNQQQIEVAGIKTATAGPGSLDHIISLSGQINLNADTLINHVSRADGIVIELNVSEGDYVRKGEVMALIDSAELGQAKSEFYEIFNEVGCCAIDLQRFKIVSTNASKLLDALEKLPEISSLQNAKFGDMADYGAQLLKSYAQYSISKKNFQRKNRLFQSKIVSENDFLSAQNEYEKAMADFFASRDNARFELKQRLLDLERLMKVNEFKLRTAERRLQLLGLSFEEINKIREQGSKIQETCTDPNCKDCIPGSASHSRQAQDSTFSQIAIKAARSGTVTFRNLSLGEEVEKNRILFTVADTSNLWGIFQASLQDVSMIRQGMEVTIKSPDRFETIGRVLMISPVVDQKTRTISVRTALNNDSGRWLPGNFITGQIKIAADNLPVVINRSAIQTVNGETVVFVPNDHGFNMQEVETGREDGERVEIKSGLKAGQKYVSEGAFALKSVKITSTMDSHAGHGH